MMKVLMHITTCLAIFLFIGCKKIAVKKAGTMPPSNALFDSLLISYVDSIGLVDYKGLKVKEAVLDQYLLILRNAIPNDSSWDRQDKIAYWINLYNAYTLKLILNHYPIESIKDIGSSIQVPFVNTPWDIKFIVLNGKKYDLNNIEHNILRKFGEPRIHFAIVCASSSCPVLRNEAYTGEKLESQLESQAVNFLLDPLRNRIFGTDVRISKIFQWFKGDFTQSGSLVDFLNGYLEKPIPASANVDFLPYDWGLNSQQ